MNPTRQTIPASPRRARAAWRGFEVRDGREIDRQLREGRDPSCPCCGELLEARPETRMTRYLPLDATGFDLECRDCRRFRCVVRHTFRSLRLVRMRRLVAAVRAAGGRGEARFEDAALA
jgi:hypothetical protein